MREGSFLSGRGARPPGVVAGTGVGDAVVVEVVVVARSGEGEGDGWVVAVVASAGGGSADMLTSTPDRDRIGQRDYRVRNFDCNGLYAYYRSRWVLISFVVSVVRLESIEYDSASFEMGDDTTAKVTLRPPDDVTVDDAR